jgi:hypothetical protein
MRWFRLEPGTLTALACLLASPIAAAHVGFTVEDDLVVAPGETVTLEWEDIIEHDTVAYHLELIVDGDEDPESIASDLAPDVHSFDWVVPEISCADCQLHIIQDNEINVDYNGYRSVRIGDAAGDASGATSASAGGSTSSSGGEPTGSGAGGATGNAAITSGGVDSGNTASVSTGGAGSQGMASTMGAVGSQGGSGTSAGQPADTEGSGGCALRAPTQEPGQGALLLLLGLGLLGVARRAR